MEDADRWIADGEKRQLLDGRLGAADGGQRALIEPATGAPLATVAACGPVDAARALASARAAVDDGPWPRMGARDRAQRLRALATAIAEDEETLVRVEARGSGRPAREARIDVRFAAAVLLAEAERASAAQGAWRSVGRTVEAVCHPAPLGVVLVVAGAHAPLRSAIGAAAPALAAGNAVIVLPHPRTPLSALRVGELARAASIPPGALQILSGGYAAVCQLAAEDAVDVCAADLGLEDAQWLRQARGTRPLRMADRRKGTLLALAGADPAAAADQAVLGACYGQGAISGGLQRLVAHRKVHDHVVLKILTLFSNLTLGNPIDPDCEIGPLGSEQQFEEAQAYIAAACASGATLVQGGKRQQGARLDGGYYMQPALLVGAGPAIESWLQDVPAPVLLVHEAPDEDAAVAALPPHGACGAIGARQDLMAGVQAQCGGRDVWYGGWNLAEAMEDPQRSPWRQEDFCVRRTVWRTTAEPTGWYRGG